ncbi:hypothetical protein APV28_0305 [Comamonas testosteroni]|nr:hypothetical protein APV28_0305 [Comamonas testosteroni]
MWGEAQTWGRAELDECQDMRCMPWSVLRILGNEYDSAVAA